MLHIRTMLRTRLRKLCLNLLLFQLHAYLWCGVSCSRLAGSPYTVINNNGYEHVVVAINPTVEQAQRQQLIENLKKLLEETSKQLFYSTNSMVHLKQVDILIPSDWPNIQQESLATFQSFDQADIVVAPPNPYHRDQPYGLQSGKCGFAGHHVHLTPTFINNLKNPKTIIRGAKSVAAAWAQFRYGVFEECGSPNDLVHPHVFLNGPKVAVTSCATYPLTGKFQGDCNKMENLIHGQCKFLMNSDQTSADPSIMFSTDLTDASQKFCNDSNHDKFTPTKHNILCNGKSTLSVIKSSRELRSVVPKPNLGVNAVVPKFNIVRAAPDKYVLLIDISLNMKIKNRFSNILLGINRLVHHHIPYGLELGLLSFDSIITNLRDINPITDESSKKVFLNGLPTSQSNNADVNIGEAIMEGISMFETLGRKGGRSTLVLVTGGDLRYNRIDVNFICQRLLQSQIRLNVILYVTEKREADQHNLPLQQLANCSYGNLFVVADIRIDDPFSIVSREVIDTAFRTAVDVNDPIKRPLQIYEGKHKSTESVTNSYFYVTKNVNDNLCFSVSYDKIENLNKVILKDPTGHVYDNNHESYDKDEKEKHITLMLTNVPGGNWTYQITWSNVGLQHIGIVKASTIPNAEQIRIECWTEVYNNTNHTLGAVAGKTPIVIYAKLMKGQIPIIDAKVEADVILPPEDSNQKLYRVKLLLSDDGGGDPDISKHDGIYSRYFTQFTTKEGFYAFRVTATDNGKAKIPITNSTTRNKSEFGVCANNSVTLMPTEPFFRTALGETFYVSKVEYSVADPFPPARICDLHIAEIQNQTIILSWTAVGNDFDNDKQPFDTVRRYEIRGSPDRKLITDEKFSEAEDLYPYIRIVVASKQKQNATFKLLKQGIPYYLAARGYDGTSYGLISNVITVTQEKNESDISTVTAGAVVGITVGLLIFLVLIAFIIIYLRRRSRTRYDFPRISFREKKYKDPVSPAKTAEVTEPLNEKELNKLENDIVVTDA